MTHPDSVKELCYYDFKRGSYRTLKDIADRHSVPRNTLYRWVAKENWSARIEQEQAQLMKKLDEMDQTNETPHSHTEEEEAHFSAGIPMDSKEEPTSLSSTTETIEQVQHMDREQEGVKEPIQRGAKLAQERTKADSQNDLRQSEKAELPSMKEIRRGSKVLFVRALNKLSRLMNSAGTLKEMKDGVATAYKILEGCAKAEGEPDQVIQVQTRQIVQYDIRLVFGRVHDILNEAQSVGLINDRALDRLRDMVTEELLGLDGKLAYSMEQLGEGDLGDGDS